jgi:serine/threonine protein kinase/sugar lactone lactonase YvrE
MHPDRWQQLSRIYHALAHCDPADRAAFLDEMCRGDSALHRELESLLAHARSGDTLVGTQPPRPLPSLVGTRVGAYEVREVMGAGGMGDVYRAHDTRLHRDVALKILPEVFASDADRLARFRREAQVLGSLNHPNIAQIYGLEDADGRYGLVLELVEGPTLADRIAGGPIALDAALAIARQLADALQAAHDRGIVHRDLKPANIKVRADGTVKVLDFGLAKALAAGTVGVTTADSAQTSRGVVLGTVPYMAPEQARGADTDERVDVWAFGAVLYEMVTGRSPFAAGSVADTLGAILYREPDWDRVPAGVQLPLSRCLEKDANRRLRRIADVRAALEALPASSQRRPLRRVALAGAAAVAAVSLAWVSLADVDAPPPVSHPVRFQILPPPQSTFGGYFVVSPDGRHVAFQVVDSSGRRSVWVHSFETGSARPLARAGDLSASSIIWSGDSRFVGFVSGGGKMMKIDIQGGAPQVIGEIPRGWGGAAWNSDEVIVLGQAEGGLLRVSARGGRASPLTRLDAARQEVGHGGPRFLPDGRHFIYSRASRVEANTGVYIGSIDSGPGQQPSEPILVTDSRPAYAPSADPDHGHLLVVRDGVLLAYPFDARRLALAGEPVPIAEDVAAVPNGPVSIAAVSASGNGVLAYRRTERIPGVPVWVGRDGREMGALADETLATPISLRISPDGTRVAMRVGGDLWVYHVDGRPPIKLTFDGNAGISGTPVWSPDGRSLVYEDQRFDGRLRSVLADRLAAPRTVSPRGHFHPFGWAPDGGVLAAVLTTNANVTAARVDGSSTMADVDVVTFAPEETATARALVKTLSPEGGDGVALSPDGRWLAYTSRTTGRNEIWVQPFEGTDAPVRVSPDGGVEPQWARDGRELYYLEGKHLMAVPVHLGPSFQFGPPAALFEHNDVRFSIPSYDVAPDGRFLVIKSSGPAFGTSPIQVVLNWQEELKQRVPTR